MAGETGMAGALAGVDTANPDRDAQGAAGPAPDTRGYAAEGTPERVRLDTLNRALADSQAQCTSAHAHIASLVQRNAQLEQELIVLARREKQARRLAYHDALTGLANRALLQDRLAQALSQAQRSRRLLAVLLIDLDGFKRINDTLGHSAGDRVLQAVGARLSASVRAADTACRHGGDEFVVMLPEVDDPATVAAVVAKVRLQLSEPHVIDRHEIRMTASVGTALYPSDGTSYEQLMNHADSAMYLAKAASGPAAIQVLLELARTAPRQPVRIACPLDTDPIAVGSADAVG